MRSVSATFFENGNAYVVTLLEQNWKENAANGIGYSTNKSPSLNRELRLCTCVHTDCARIVNQCGVSATTPYCCCNDPVSSLFIMV